LLLKHDEQFLSNLKVQFGDNPDAAALIKNELNQINDINNYKNQLDLKNDAINKLLQD